MNKNPFSKHFKRVSGNPEDSDNPLNLEEPQGYLEQWRQMVPRTEPGKEALLTNARGQPAQPRSLLPTLKHRLQRPDTFTFHAQCMPVPNALTC